MSRPRDQRGRFLPNWVVVRADGSYRVIRHVDPAIPEPETRYVPLADRLASWWLKVCRMVGLALEGKPYREGKP